MNKQTLLTGWNFTRWLRLLLGVLFAMQTIQTQELLPGFIAALFIFQAMTNTGCCGTNGCAIPVRKNQGAAKILDDGIKQSNSSDNVN